MSYIFICVRYSYYKVLSDIWKYSCHVIKQRRTLRKLLKTKERKRKIPPRGKKSPQCFNILQWGISGLPGCNLQVTESAARVRSFERSLHSECPVSGTTWKSQKKTTAWPWGKTLKHLASEKMWKSSSAVKTAMPIWDLVHILSI